MQLRKTNIDAHELTLECMKPEELTLVEASILAELVLLDKDYNHFRIACVAVVFLYKSSFALGQTKYCYFRRARIKKHRF